MGKLQTKSRPLQFMRFHIASRSARFVYILLLFSQRSPKGRIRIKVDCAWIEITKLRHRGFPQTEQLVKYINK